MTYIVSTKQVTQTTAPAVEPVSLQEVKVHCGVDDTGDYDTFLTMAIKAIRQWVEKQYGLSLVQRTYRADVSGWSYTYRLPYPPLSSVTSIKYYNTDSPQVLTTLASNQFNADLGRSEVYLDADASTLPSVSSRHNAVQITYVSGFELSTDSPVDLRANVDSAIKAAIKLQVADLFDNRSTHSTIPKIVELNTTEMLLAPWREY